MTAKAKPAEGLDGRQGESGFVAVDAVVALLIVATVLTLALQAQGLALKWARRAHGLRLATAEASLRLAASGGGLSAAQTGAGADGAMPWSIARVQSAAPDRGRPALCATTAKAGTVTLRTEDFCPPAAKP